MYKFDERFFFAVSCILHLCLLLVFSSKVLNLSFYNPKPEKSLPFSTQINIEKFSKEDLSQLQKASTKKQNRVQKNVVKAINTPKEKLSIDKKSNSKNISQSKIKSSTFVADFSSKSAKAPKELQKFFRSLISEIHNKKNYPRLSKKLRESGTVHIKFMVNSNGEVRETKLIKSSQYQRLNKSALKVVSQLEIKEPLPSNYDNIVITFPMSYIL